ncbi:MAG: hypothetical protein ACHQYQ_00545 [Bacteriovoracales bacterium]
MKILIILFLCNLAFGGEEDSGLFYNQKEKVLKESKEQENPNLEEIDCIEKADNRNALNRCKNVIRERKREEKKNK